MLSKASVIKKGVYAYQWLVNVDTHVYAKFDQNLPCGSRVVSIFIYQTDSHSDYSTHLWVVKK